MVLTRLHQSKELPKGALTKPFVTLSRFWSLGGGTFD